VINPDLTLAKSLWGKHADTKAGALAMSMVARIEELERRYQQDERINKMLMKVMMERIK
jgi:hypothetical protein